MATTSTNKQPLLVDRILHYVVSTRDAYNNSIDITGANTAELLVNASNTDGAIIEDIYVISRGTDAATINFYLSSASDYLRPDEGFFIGQVTSSTGAAGDIVRWEEMPRILAPVPQAGDVPTGHAAYDKLEKHRRLQHLFKQQDDLFSSVLYIYPKERTCG